MGILEMIYAEVQQLRKEVAELKQAPPADDTSLVDSHKMAKELGMSYSSFNNTILNKMVQMKLARKVGGRWKARRCDFEKYKMIA